MKRSEFIRLPDIENEEDMDSLEVGEYFLYGTAIIGQKQNKMADKPITYYEVLGKEGRTVNYAPVYDKLEADKVDKED